MHAAIKRAKDYSESKLSELRRVLEALVPPGEVVLTCGSYARREASNESDIDFFVVSNLLTSEETDVGDFSKIPWLGEIKAAIGKIVAIEPAEGGAFSNVEPRAAIIKNIGGDNDTNAKMTRRMLFLLEGEWLSNHNDFNTCRRTILDRYIGDRIGDHQLALFLLNDVIRYYRTIAVDYEFKTAEGPTPKPWGIRNIKLIFSRKLLYASGIFSVAKTADHAHAEKIRLLENLLSMPVIDRMVHICGEARMEPVLSSYNHFLERLEDSQVRERLKKLGREDREDSLFRDLKNEGHNFTRELMKLFEATFDRTHPIHRAIIF